MDKRIEKIGEALTNINNDLDNKERTIVALFNMIETLSLNRHRHSQIVDWFAINLNAELARIGRPERLKIEPQGFTKAIK